MRAWRQVLDRHDGSFLVLYRAYESIDELIIRVKYNGKDVAESPYVLRGNRPLFIDLSHNDVKCGFEMLYKIGLALEKCQANHI